MLCPARAAIWAGGAPAFGRKDSAAVAGRSSGTRDELCAGAE